VKSDVGQGTLLRFSTEDLPPSERVPFWREIFGRQCAQIEVEPLSDRPLEHRGVVLATPGFSVIWSHSRSPTSWKRTSQLVADGDDDYALLMTLSGAMTRSQRGRDLEVHGGQGVGILHAEPARMAFREHKHIGLIVPRSALFPLVRDLEDASTRLIPRTVEALRLLRGYLNLLRRNADIADAEVCRLAATHIYDLAALAIGATRDGRRIALARGVRAVRLEAIKSELALSPSLSISEIAARQGITPRYIQLLFDAEGTTFSAYALGRRLERAHRMLVSPHYATWSVSAIAFEAGFGDLSHFNRNFRRRYGASPSEVRAETSRSKEQSGNR
jgi:AraC-like DNA-binding protein